jgi:biopolymer transport protein ExbD
MDLRSPRGDNQTIASINVTPLVDVSLVLVIIFMIVAPLAMQSGIGVKSIQQPGARAVKPPSGEVVIEIQATGLAVNRQKTDLAHLPFVLRTLLPGASEQMVYLVPGDEVQHGFLVAVMDLAKQAGAKRLAIVSQAELEELQYEKTQP